MKILIAGAGIAGLTAAFFLCREGFEVTVVERAARVRPGGYMIDFFGPGYDVAEQMGILQKLQAVHYPIANLTFLRPDGRKSFTVEYEKVRKLFRDRHYNFLRGALERILHDLVKDQVTFRFGAGLGSLRASEGGGVEAFLDDGTFLSADVVIGADGAHSTTRRLMFGPEGRFERFLGYHAAAFVFDTGPQLHVRADTFYTLTEPGRQLSLYPLGDGRLATLFIHRAAEPVDRETRENPRRRLREVYSGMRWMAPVLLEHLEDLPSIYYDDVSQVVLPRWSDGRVGLVGDACQCVSLLAGQGASMAMAGARALADSLVRNRGDIPGALASYEARIKPLIDEKQRGGRRMARWFVPRSSAGIAVRNLLTRAVVWPFTSDLARRYLAANDPLPEVPAGG